MNQDPIHKLAELQIARNANQEHTDQGFALYTVRAWKMQSLEGQNECVDCGEGKFSGVPGLRTVKNALLLKRHFLLVKRSVFV